MEPAPVTLTDRHQSLDVLRGIAVLGILMVNIPTFFMLPEAYQYPPADPGFDAAGAQAWLFVHVFFEMKFITIFSALFGAGILLMTGYGPDSSTKVHYRRMLWLLAFGMVHAYALWFGDILVSYAVFGMIAVLFRKMSAGKLVFWGFFWITLTGLLMVGMFASFMMLPEEMDPASIGMAQSPEAAASIIAAYQEGSAGRWGHNALMALMAQLSGMALFGGRVIGVMFLGMALFKSGFLTAKWGVTKYAASAFVGLAIGLPLAWYGGQHAVADNFDLRGLWLHTATNYVASLLMAFGYASIVMLICKIPVLALLRVPFAAAGRMAFTNYLTQTITLVILSTGTIGLGLYGTLGREELIPIVLSIWMVQLAVSVIWLQVFRFGPFEWLWRSLTYWKLQPITKPKA
ncbi:hypothetical protein X907_1369 [Glycocaulis alkaliphilus]|uniref:Uncharacterized protein n=1 Tax=Glycocaulis alkaliphilus TaxID=1434191 RepID=A0A3T0E9F3_9PROT|nr:DUF418 domain-containing protein [Glycocaulis alkaliphilus]AZU03902.1 hypothetical protein X907_1369 [Glycocaulis alkaliphilus]GGB85935.1 hypothetical protein GCM10007417_27460 [Glycocaulis alkaliphilus]